MKIVLAGVGHWHTPLYLEPLLQQPHAKVVGVCDGDPVVAETYGRRLGCFQSTSLAAVLDRTNPDFAFVLGPHSAMASDARLLIESRVPFAIEKPAGISASEVGGLAEAARKADLFVSVPLVFRSSDYFRIAMDHISREGLLYADFKFIAGPTSRYREAGCEWMLDRRTAGGGALFNLGVHFLDLFRLLTASQSYDILGAAFANLGGDGDVEDYFTLTARCDRAVARVESGYLYPAEAGTFDMHFSVRTGKHYVRSLGPGHIEVSDFDGTRRIIKGTTTNMPIYPGYVADVLKQVVHGRPPVADLDDMTKVMRLVESACACVCATKTNL